MKRGLFLLVFLLCAYGGAARTRAVPPVSALVERIAPGRSGDFVFAIEDPQSPTDFFTLSGNRNKIRITGNSAVSVAAGLNYYLRSTLGITPTAYNLPLSLPKKLPVPEPVRRETEILQRPALGRESYTGERSYWGWDDWQREIDLLALNGATAVYVPVGTETVWRNLLRTLGLSEREIGEFIPMPSYGAWWLAGKYCGGGEDLPESWYAGQYELMRKIRTELEKWDIRPVAEGYNGMLPASCPGAADDLPRWKGNPVPARTDSPETYRAVAALYYRELHRLYGEFDYYLITPLGIEPETAAAALRETNPLGIRISPAKSGQYALPDPDPAGYRLYTANREIWEQQKPDLAVFVRERYGNDNPEAAEALEILLPALYGADGRPAFCSEPAFSEVPVPAAAQAEYLDALKRFLKASPAFSDNDNFQHDLILFTLEAAYRKADDLREKMGRSADTRSPEHFLRERDEFLALMQKADELLATREEFRYGTYLEKGRAKGGTFEEKGIYEGDIRQYTTIWGNRYTANMERMNDFRYQEKSGILSDYYYNRWFVFLKAVEGILNRQIEGDIDYYAMGLQWSSQRNTFREYPKSSPVLKAVELLNLIIGGTNPSIP